MKSIIKKNEGSALILSMAVMAILTTLSLALLLSTAVFSNGVQRDLTRAQVKQSALGVTLALEDELIYGPDDTVTGIKGYIREEMERYLRRQGSDWWTFTDPDLGITGVNRILSVNAPEGTMGTVTVTLSWEAVTDETLTYLGNQPGITTMRQFIGMSPVLNVVVRAEYGNEVHVINSEYLLDTKPLTLDENDKLTETGDADDIMAGIRWSWSLSERT